MRSPWSDRQRGLLAGVGGGGMGWSELVVDEGQLTRELSVHRTRALGVVDQPPTSRRRRRRREGAIRVWPGWTCRVLSTDVTRGVGGVAFHSHPSPQKYVVAKPQGRRTDHARRWNRCRRIEGRKVVRFVITGYLPRRCNGEVQGSPNSGNDRIVAANTNETEKMTKSRPKGPKEKGGGGRLEE